MIWRALRAIEHLLTGALITLAVATLRALGRAPRWQPEIVRWWHQRLCRILGLRVTVRGDIRAPALLVANHVSWLDIPVLGAQGRVGFLSKAEVRRWPIIGWMAAVAGTLFIERGANRFAEAIAAVRARIAAGSAVVVFAEGTTSAGAGVRRFLPRLFAVVQPPRATADAIRRDGHDQRDGNDHGRSFQTTGSMLPGDPEHGGLDHVSQEAPIKLQPVALRYGRGPEPHPVAPFIDDDILVSHLWRVLKHPGIEVQVLFLPLIGTEGRDRRTLAEATRAAIVGALEGPQEPTAEPAADTQDTQGPDHGDAGRRAAAARPGEPRSAKPHPDGPMPAGGRP